MAERDQYCQERRSWRSIGTAALASIRGELATMPPTGDEELRTHVASLGGPSRIAPQELLRLVDCGHTRPGGPRCVCAIACRDHRSWVEIMDARVTP